MSLGLRTCTQKWTVIQGSAHTVVNELQNYLHNWVQDNANCASTVKINIVFDGDNSMASALTDEGTRCTYKEL